MAFFGMTTLGPSDPVREQTAPSQTYTFHELDEDTYIAVFDKYLLGNDSKIARTLELDGNSHVLRAALGDMLRELLGRPPRKHELDAWFTALDFDRSAILGREEFMKGVEELKVFSGDPQVGYCLHGHAGHASVYDGAWVCSMGVQCTCQHAVAGGVSATSTVCQEVISRLLT